MDGFSQYTYIQRNTYYSRLCLPFYFNYIKCKLLYCSKSWVKGWLIVRVALKTGYLATLTALWHAKMFGDKSMFRKVTKFGVRMQHQAVYIINLRFNLFLTLPLGRSTIRWTYENYTVLLSLHYSYQLIEALSRLLQ